MTGTTGRVAVNPWLVRCLWVFTIILCWELLSSLIAASIAWGFGQASAFDTWDLLGDAFVVAVALFSIYRVSRAEAGAGRSGASPESSASPTRGPS